MTPLLTKSLNLGHALAFTVIVKNIRRGPAGPSPLHKLDHLLRRLRMLVDPCVFPGRALVFTVFVGHSCGGPAGPSPLLQTGLPPRGWRPAPVEERRYRPRMLVDPCTFLGCALVFTIVVEHNCGGPAGPCPPRLSLSQKKGGCLRLHRHRTPTGACPSIPSPTKKPPQNPSR